MRHLFASLVAAGLLSVAGAATAQADYWGRPPPGYGWQQPRPPGWGGPGPWHPRPYGPWRSYGYYAPPPPRPPFYLGRPPMINRPPPVFVPAPGVYFGY